MRETETLNVHRRVLCSTYRGCRFRHVSSTENTYSPSVKSEMATFVVIIRSVCCLYVGLAHSPCHVLELLVEIE
jgi:hypothetical protein